MWNDFLDHCTQKFPYHTAPKLMHKFSFFFYHKTNIVNIVLTLEFWNVFNHTFVWKPQNVLPCMSFYKPNNIFHSIQL